MENTKMDMEVTVGGGDNNSIEVKDDLALVTNVVQEESPHIAMTVITLTPPAAEEYQNDNVNENEPAEAEALCEIIIGDDNRDKLAVKIATSKTTSGSDLKAIQNDSDPEVESMLFLEDEEAPTTSASSVTTGSLKVYLEETFGSIFAQVIIPLIISAIGMIGAGFYLDHVKDWDVFGKISQLFILIPALVGLKGNLEMTLASRLSTQANLGNTKNLKAKFRLTVGNLCLVQCQAIVLSSLASIIALGIGWWENGHFNAFQGLVLFSSSLATASLASFVLGVFTAFAVFTSSACNINPDNIAAPLAASLGDIVTLLCLANISRTFEGFGDMDSRIWIIILVVLGTCLIILPCCVVYACRSKSVRPLFKNGWCPIISAVVVSSIAGYILKVGLVKISPGIAVFQPVFCGIGGNIAAVQASRISTSLHHKVNLGMLPDGFRHWWRNPLSSFFSLGGNSIGARVLVVVAIPGHILVFFIIQWFNGSSDSAAKDLFPFYLIAAVIQVLLMLYMSEIIVNWLWSWEKDPDSEAIPYLTAFGDVIGLLFLGSAFLAYQWIHGTPHLL